MQLFEIPKSYTETQTKKQAEKPKETNFKLKKGQTLDTLIIAARKLVEEKLGNYKDTSKCVLDENQLINFFNQTPENGIIGIDTETTGLNVFTDKLVGISVCNGKEALYIPINHISTISGRLKNQLSADVIKKIFGDVFKNRKFNWVNLIGSFI